MDEYKTMGFLSIILGLIFMIFPMFSAELISIIVGLTLLFFGISAIFTGFNIRDGIDNTFSNILIIIGVIVTILGFAFIFYIDALSFLVGLQFYILGFIMIFFGISGLISKMNGATLASSLVILIMGIISVVLAAFAMTQPVYIAVIIGIVLVAEGIILLISN